jgi:hypothetical protein
VYGKPVVSVQSKFATIIFIIEKITHLIFWNTVIPDLIRDPVYIRTTQFVAFWIPDQVRDDRINEMHLTLTAESAMCCAGVRKLSVFGIGATTFI